MEVSCKSAVDQDCCGKTKWDKGFFANRLAKLVRKTFELGSLVHGDQSLQIEELRGEGDMHNGKHDNKGSCTFFLRRWDDQRLI